ncbi:hypothetical protein OOK39_11930 [Streptomyces sp. NBC_00264]|uniref:hypothetical protein n=1 Tax=unclassified Streptomyces TaxID=2593676 RepID=UPI0022517B5D|nr:MULTISPECIES: hypothetical protein [unclassified Streptomyces]MCX5159982.1 hypothetical protein [Streptomyces sp. NBC_00305]MCX5218505.1 hypothetical protein [Streptomyces sp. NBC_00264]WSC30185.1 hypothetical protein OG902_27780 [Streptomyces sp. NBC_01768]
MPSDPEFIAYMRAFEASTTHVGACTACQNDQPCKTGRPIHAEFIARQDAWTKRVRTERKKP